MSGRPFARPPPDGHALDEIFLDGEGEVFRRLARFRRVGETQSVRQKPES